MTQLRELLRLLVDEERRIPGPPVEAVEDCWQRIAADVERGACSSIDVPPPAAPRPPWLKIVVPLLSVLLPAAALYSSGATAPPPRTPESAAISAPPAEAAIAARPLLPPEPAAPVAVPVLPELAMRKRPAEEVEMPRPPRIRSRTANPTVAREEDTFAAELRLLARGQAALARGDHGEALRLADLYQKTYPKGHFGEDGEALHVLALCSSGAGKGRRSAHRFLRLHPRSIHAARVRDTCDVYLDD